MDVVQSITDVSEVEELMCFECPGCGIDHEFRIKSPTRPCWTFNGDKVKPTFSPSLLVKWGDMDEPNKVCHSYVREGIIEFLSDCTHRLAGKSVPLPPCQTEG